MDTARYKRHAQDDLSGRFGLLKNSHSTMNYLHIPICTKDYRKCTVYTFNQSRSKNKETKKCVSYNKIYHHMHYDIYNESTLQVTLTFSNLVPSLQCKSKASPLLYKVEFTMITVPISKEPRFI